MPAKSLLILFLFFISTFAQEIDANISNTTIPVEDFTEIDNLIVAETVTKIGNDFYESFYNGWESPANTPNFTIIISEKPFPGRGNLIIVNINDIDIFQRFVTPRYDEIVEVAGIAISATKNYLISYEEIQKQLNDEDLIGSGIF